MDTPNDPAVLDTPADPVTTDPIEPVIPPDPKPADPTPVAAKNWYDSLPEDFRENPTVQKYKSQEEMVKGHLELTTLLGNEKIAIPKDEKDLVAIEQFNKKFGIPMSAAGYKITPPAPPTGMENMEFGLDGFKEVAHRRGLSTVQAQGLAEDYVAMLGAIKAESEKQYIEVLEATKGELTKEWGLKFNEKIKLGQHVMNTFTDDKAEFDHINALIGHDPKAQRWLAKIGGALGEGTLGRMEGMRPGFTKTPGDAQLEYDTIMNDPKDVYWSGTNKEAPAVPESVRKARIGHVESLLMMINAGNAKAPA